MLDVPVSALFVRSDSIYKSLLFDCYDKARNAIYYERSNAVICHPPCRAWSRLRHFANPVEGESELAIWSIDLARKNGGVVEHPLGSSLWAHMNLPLGPNIDEFGGYTVSINQHWYGHKAEKKSLLYICGCPRNKLPLIPIIFDAVEYTVCSSSKIPVYRRNKKEITKAEREHTPEKLALWLIEVASLCHHYKQLSRP